MSLRQTYFFDISKDSDIEGIVYASIVPERFWKRNGYMADSTPTELYEELESAGFAEAMECVFDFEGTQEEAEAALLKAGLRRVLGLPKEFGEIGLTRARDRVI